MLLINYLFLALHHKGCPCDVFVIMCLKTRTNFFFFFVAVENIVEKVEKIKIFNNHAKNINGDTVDLFCEAVD